MKRLLLLSLVFILPIKGASKADKENLPVDSHNRFVWNSIIPDDCPFKQSSDLKGMVFTKRHAEYGKADTWYPSWASDGNMYSPWTDGWVNGCHSRSAKKKEAPSCTTGSAKIIGNDPLHLKIVNETTYVSEVDPYQSRYPCGSLVYNGVWYYGTYCLHGGQVKKHKGITYNWPWLGPFVGFRYSTDFGKTWVQTPCTPKKPLFGEQSPNGSPLKIGSPHFVDFGKNMEHSPDGKAYLVAHGASDGKNRRFGYNSWITGDEVYMLRVTPTIKNMNDPSSYEFFDGKGWTKDFSKIKPVVSWRDKMGCVTMTYNAPLKKYLMCVTDGMTTGRRFNTYILESDKITGPFKMVQYLNNFGEQGYFVNFPSKFISKDGMTMWLSYSGNFARNWDGHRIKKNPPSSRYAWCLHEVKLLTSNNKKQVTNPIKAVKTTKSGALFSMKHGLLDVSYVAPNIVHIRCTREKSFSKKAGDIISLAGEPKTGAVNVKKEGKRVSISNGKLQVRVNRSSGALSFFDKNNVLLFGEPNDSPRSFKEIAIKNYLFDLKSAKTIKTVDGGRVEMKAKVSGKTKRAWTVQQNFKWVQGEALYGLGSHEENVLNLRGTMQYLYQQNMKSVVPVLVSSKGYGILFNATCEMEFHDDKEGSFIKLDAVRDLDYYVIYGPEFDQIVAGYRELTGAVPMFPRWAFGYWQSKERYKNQKELIAVVEEYRRRKLPLDLIVQDWQYWPTGWGIKEFDAKRYPTPTAMCERIHELNAHIMISIWPFIAGNHPEPKAMKKGKYMLKNNRTYDAYSAAARAKYWYYANTGLFKHGIDAWWCDCTEPFEADWHGNKKLSSEERRNRNIEVLRKFLGRERVNSYSLLHSRGIYENQRKTTDKKRVLNLTRSAYAGQQRYGAITWSGDVAARWEVLAQQIPTGLNFTVTGCPYWTNDIGAFFVKKKGRWFWNGQFSKKGCNDLGYREFYTRWFQYGAFLPIFRSHGTDTSREIWRFGNPGEMFYDSLVKYLNLRYRLLPYIYSLAGKTTQEHYTMMRALAFDFRSDPKALDIKNQYMFGPAFMVCPVTTPMYYRPKSKKLNNIAKTRKVYLPKGTDWYDFWTGTQLKGGQTITANAPIETMPLYIRAGSIIPMGPLVQYSDEKLAADWTIRIYPGADASFTVYEDGGDGYDYEKGEFATWKLSWNDATSTLSIGERKGRFPNIIESRKLNIIVIRKATDASKKLNITRTINYTGKRINIQCP